MPIRRRILWIRSEAVGIIATKNNKAVSRREYGRQPCFALSMPLLGRLRAPFFDPNGQKSTRWHILSMGVRLRVFSQTRAQARKRKGRIMYLENQQLRTTGLCRRCREERGACDRREKQDKTPPSGGCVTGEGSRWGLVGYPVASMYAPLQSFSDLYDNATAWQRGTLFSSLDLPFEGMSVSSKGGCGCG